MRQRGINSVNFSAQIGHMAGHPEEDKESFSYIQSSQRIVRICGIILTLLEMEQ